MFTLLMYSLLAACSRAPAPAPPAAVEAPGPGTYAYAHARLDEQIGAAEARAIRYANDWGRWAEVASVYTERARLTGDYADFARAEDAYAVAFEMAPQGSGPLLGRSALHFALHRLDAAEADLDTMERRRLDDPTRAEILRARADIALQRGQLDVARRLYDEALAVRPTMAARYGLAQLALLGGDHDRALALLDGCEELVVGERPSARMWLDLQRGLVELDRGRDAEALAHYRDADAEVSGHWLVREHIAEATRRLGRPEEALAMYEQIVLETHHPEFMAAIASILAERGDRAGAERWAAWAEAGFARQLVSYPEAAAGHALAFYLERGDAAQAVRLAEANAALRPNREALTALAEAYRLAGRAADERRAATRASAVAALASVAPR